MNKLGTLLLSTVALCASFAAAQNESEFSKQCKAALRKACKAESWANTSSSSYSNGNNQIYLSPLNAEFTSTVVSIACDGSQPLRTALPKAAKAGYQGDFNKFVFENSDLITRVANRAAEIEQNCAIAELQATLLQRQIDIAQESQNLLKGDIQAILTKLVPGATVTITVPKPEPAASAPKAANK